MGANSFTWLPGFSNLQTILDAPLISFVYTVVGTAPGCSAGATTTVQITVSSLPTITVNSASVCIGGTVTLAASGGMNYAWSNSASGPVIFVTPTISTIYTVTGSFRRRLFFHRPGECLFVCQSGRKPQRSGNDCLRKCGIIDFYRQSVRWFLSGSRDEFRSVYSFTRNNRHL